MALPTAGWAGHKLWLVSGRAQIMALAPANWAGHKLWPLPMLTGQGTSYSLSLASICAGGGTCLSWSRTAPGRRCPNRFRYASLFMGSNPSGSSNSFSLVRSLLGGGVHGTSRESFWKGCSSSGNSLSLRARSWNPTGQSSD
jgi:hypothetical protein